MNRASEIFIYSDQPTTCVTCGRRTEIVLDSPFSDEKTQIHKCPSIDCGFEFVLKEDSDFEDGSLL